MFAYMRNIHIWYCFDVMATGKIAIFVKYHSKSKMFVDCKKRDEKKEKSRVRSIMTNGEVQGMR